MQYMTADGGRIIVPQKTIAHLRAHPEVADILEEVIGKISLPTDGAFLRTEVEMGRIVGLTGCVSAPRIELGETAMFAKRLERAQASRVVLDSQGEETSTVSVLSFASREDARTYVLITAWVGFLAPKEPWDPNIRSEEELQESLDFWSSHALVYNPTVMGAPFASSWQKILGGAV